VSRKYTTEAPDFAETGYDLPADLDAPTVARIHELVVTTLNVAGHRSGPSQTEVVLTPNGPRLIESHARPGAECVQELLLTATGTDLVARTIATLLGLPVPEPRPAAGDRFAGIRFLRFPPGQLRTVEGTAEVRALSGVTGLKITVPLGSHVPEATSRVAGHGYLTAVADGPQELEAVLRKAQDLLRPVVVRKGTTSASARSGSPKEGEHSAA
jgi:L-amino acid ligase C-terminal domain 2